MELYSFLRKNEKHQRNNWNVSVSLWSIIHSYSQRDNFDIVEYTKVSVSLWSYIHSYQSKNGSGSKRVNMVSVSLQSYIHSY